MYSWNDQHDHLLYNVPDCRLIGTESNFHSSHLVYEDLNLYKYKWSLQLYTILNWLLWSNWFKSTKNGNEMIRCELGVFYYSQVSISIINWLIDIKRQYSLTPYMIILDLLFRIYQKRGAINDLLLFRLILRWIRQAHIYIK